MPCLNAKHFFFFGYGIFFVKSFLLKTNFDTSFFPILKSLFGFLTFKKNILN